MKDSTQIKLWLLAFVLTCLVAWAAHGALRTPPPLPKVKKVHKTTEVQRGATKLIARIVLPGNRTNTIAWSYPPAASNYWWNLECSTNPGSWFIVISNVTATNCIVTASKAPGLTAFRLHGRTVQ